MGPRRDAADRHRGMGGVQSAVHQADAEGAQVRGRRHLHDLQGSAARHRRAAAVHGLPLRRARPLARRVLPGSLWRADGRRADGRGLRQGHVPRHRGPHVRCHRAGHQPQGTGPAHPPAAAGTIRPTSALPVDGDHRRVVPGGAVHPGDGRRRGQPRAPCELDPIDPNDEGMADYSGELLADVDFGAFSHSALVRIADEVCLQMHLLVLSFTLAVREARQGRCGARAVDPYQATDRHRRGGRRANPQGAQTTWRTSRARCGCSNCIRC